MPLPDPAKDLESFWVWFLDGYQSDQRVALLDDMYKYLQDEHEGDERNGVADADLTCKSKDELLLDIKVLENKLTQEAYANFYQLVLSNQIEVIFR